MTSAPCRVMLRAIDRMTDSVIVAHRWEGTVARSWLVVSLLGSSVACGGCLYVPVPSKPYHSSTRDPRTAVSSAFARRPLELNKSTRDDVLAVLNAPTLCSADGREIGYQWVAVEAYLLVIGMPALPERKCHILIFTFDEGSILRGTRVSTPREAYQGMKWVDGKPLDALPPLR